MFNSGALLYRKLLHFRTEDTRIYRAVNEFLISPALPCCDAESVLEVRSEAAENQGGRHVVVATA